MIWLADWLAAAFEAAGKWLIGDKNRNGFILKLISNALWIVVALTVYNDAGHWTPRLGLFSIAIVANILNVRNYIKWRKGN